MTATPDSEGALTVDAVVLDIDGVLVDVADSYRRAIISAVEAVYGTTITREDVHAFKNAGGFNNDWDLTAAAALVVLARREGLTADVEDVTDRIATSGGGLSGARTVVADALDPAARERVFATWNPDALRDVFQQRYLGSERYRKLEGREPDAERTGLIDEESPLVAPDTIAALSSRFDVGVLTGRPAAEAAIALDRLEIDVPDAHRITMDDPLAGKPDPAGLLALAERFDADAVAFAGDTVDDVQTAKNAVTADPDRAYHGIGVLTGGLSGESGREAFTRAGAHRVIDSIDDLPGLLESPSENASRSVSRDDLDE